MPVPFSFHCIAFGGLCLSVKITSSLLALRKEEWKKQPVCKLGTQCHTCSDKVRKMNGHIQVVIYTAYRRNKWDILHNPRRVHGNIIHHLLLYKHKDILFELYLCNTFLAFVASVLRIEGTARCSTRICTLIYIYRLLHLWFVF
jgi:hypothetical protein